MIKEQTGFLFELRPTDYITGASPIVGVEINSKGDWTSYLPTGEKQYKYATFDTMSCTTFSFLNAIETSVNFFRANNKLSAEQITTLNTLGFYADGKFNCSDRFTAIMSGTMPNGNYFQNVGDSVRKDGLLPEGLLSFGGNTQLEYLDKSLITEEMKATAKKILDILDIKYEWTSVDDFKNQLKQCPIQGAIPEEARHAVMIPVYDKYFDSYEPFLKKLPVVKYAMKVIVTVKTPKKPEEVKEIYKPKNFVLKELVSPEILKQFGEKAWEFFDERLLRNLQFLRDNLGPIRVNNGTTFKYRGFDACEYRKNGVSQHNHGRGVDYDVVGKPAQKVREWILINQDRLPEPNCWIEDGVDWNHMDVRCSDKKGVYVFKG